MSVLLGRGPRLLCVVVFGVSVIISTTAYSDTADCELEAASVSGLSLRPTTPGVSPGSTPAPVQPGASNASGNRESTYAEVYAACVRRQATAQTPRTSQPSASPSEAREKQPEAREKER